MIHDVLRGEWGFDGLVVSDWFGLHSTAEGVTAGLDLEMPGPTLHRGQKLVDAVAEGKASAADVRRSARQVLASMLRLGAFDDGRPGPELTRDLPEDRALVRHAGAEGMVLLRNEPADAPVLPLRVGDLRRVAVIGPNAAAARPRGAAAPTCPPPTFQSARCTVGPARSGRRRRDLCGWLHHAQTSPHVVAGVVHSLRCRLVQIARRCADAGRPTRRVDDGGVEPDDVGGGPHRSQVGSAAPGFSARFHTTFTPDVNGTWQFGVGRDR